MYRLTLIIAIVFGILSFTLSEKGTARKGKSEKKEAVASVNLLKFDSDQKGNKGNKGANKNQKKSPQKGSRGGKKNGDKRVSFGGKSNKGGKKGNKQPNKGNKANKGKPRKGNTKKAKSIGKKNGQGQYANGRYKKPKKGKNGQLIYPKGHPNFRYVYANKHGGYSHKNFGQWRSQQARNKHKNYRPFYEYEAVAGFNLIISRNSFLYTETKYKIDLLNTKLKEKRSSGGITLVQYNTYVDRIETLKRRRASLEINITL